MAETGTYTSESFTDKMDTFISYCEKEGVDATDYQLIKFFGITPIMLDNYRAAHKLVGTDGIAVSLKKLDLYREDATIRQAVSDPKLISHCALKLRQPHWGGWSDKGNGALDVIIRVEIGDGDRELME